VPLWLLLIVFILVPLAEIYVILQVAELLGGGIQGAALTVVLLAVDSMIGALLLRSQGKAVWRRFNAVLSEGRVPHREIVDGVLVIVGGALLLTPGFLSDILGVLLLVPPTRAVVRRVVVRRVTRRAAASASSRRPGQPSPADYDVEGTATEYEPPPRRLER
jgi:UPF0716 protein FxsA